MAGDITRVTFNVLNFSNSETIESFSNEEVGQWVRLWCKSILLGKEASLPDDLPLLAKYAETHVRKLSQKVLDTFPVVLTEYGPRRRNRVLYEEWVRVCGKSEKARESADRKWNRDGGTSQESSLESTKEGCERIATAERPPSVRNANRTEQYITEQDRTEQRGAISQAFDEMDEENSGIVEQQGGRQKGQPGFFARGQYPGTSSKHIWKHAANAWSRLRGAGAVCRFPTKYPGAKTDAWQDLCDTKSGDLIIPAFELWIMKYGQFLETQYPLSEFMKGTNVQEFLAQVSPLNQVKPKLSVQTIEASNEIARQQHAAAWDIKTEAVEPGPDALFADEEKIA